MVDYGEFCRYWTRVTDGFETDIVFAFCVIANAGIYDQCAGGSVGATVITEQTVRNAFSLVDFGNYIIIMPVLSGIVLLVNFFSKARYSEFHSLC